jgi:SAM-dependent methyltransferase
MNPYHQANRARWDAAAENWGRMADGRGIWQACSKKPELALAAEELRALGDVRGKSVCVLGSGDNQVVFALAGMGANVTSVDLSANQLAIAQDRARTLGLTINFLRADVTELGELADSTFDLVFTGGHVAVWVSDLNRYYREAARILSPGGRFIVSEYHPFCRVWKDQKGPLVIEHHYFDRGPHRFDATTDILSRATGSLESFEFHWTVADYLSAVMASGCRIDSVEEFGNAPDGWEAAEMEGLPVRLMICATKP